MSRSGGAEWGASGGHELQTKDYPQMIAALLLTFVLFGCRLVSRPVTFLSLTSLTFLSHLSLSDRCAPPRGAGAMRPSPMLAYAGVCWRMLTFADVAGAMRPSAAVAAARVGILAAAVALAHTLCVKVPQCLTH